MEENKCFLKCHWGNFIEDHICYPVIEHKYNNKIYHICTACIESIKLELKGQRYYCKECTINGREGCTVCENLDWLINDRLKLVD